MELRGCEGAQHGGAYGESLDGRIPRWAKSQNMLALVGLERTDRSSGLDVGTMRSQRKNYDKFLVCTVIRRRRKITAQ